MNPVLKIVTSNGVPFNVLFRKDGGKYGDVVEFYDARYPQFDELGEYVSSYYAFSILDSKEEYGVNLVPYVDDWFIDGKNMGKIRKWIQEIN